MNLVTEMRDHAFHRYSLPLPFSCTANDVPDLSRAPRAVAIIVNSTMGAAEPATENDILFINGIRITAATHDKASADRAQRDLKCDMERSRILVRGSCILEVVLRIPSLGS
jgi:hypothetical protein